VGQTTENTQNKHCLKPLFQRNLGKPAPEGKLTILDFNEEDGGVLVALAEPYVNHLYLAPDR